MPNPNRSSLFFLQFFKLLTILCIWNTVAFAQQSFQEREYDPSATYRVVLNNGSEFIGSVISTTTDVLIFSTKDIPKVELPFTSIKSIERLSRNALQSDGTYWFPNPNPTRYLFTNSAFNLEKGSGYYQNTYILLNSFNYGVTDFFSVGGGFELVSTFSRDVTPIYFFTPKIAFPIADKWRVGGGVLFAQADAFSIGTSYGIITYGTTDRNVTAGLGWGFFEGEFAPQPVINFSGMTRVKRKLSLVTENWLFPDGDGYYGLFSYGVRFFGENLATDLGFFNNPDVFSTFPVGIPYVGFMVTF